MEEPVGLTLLFGFLVVWPYKLRVWSTSKSTNTDVFLRLHTLDARRSNSMLSTTYPGAYLIVRVVGTNGH